MKHVFLSIKYLIILTYVIAVSFGTVATAFAVDALKVFTSQELSVFNGQNGQKAYYAYEGKVYDVTGSKLWKDGEHYGLHAGQDLTGKMGGAPHGTEVFAPFSVVGTYSVAVSPTVQPIVQKETPAVPSTTVSKVWYEQPIRIVGISLLGWSGILLGIFFVLNFATCFALPWSQLPLPWKGSRPGPDSLDGAPVHMHWTVVHKYFAWITVVIGIVHGILGLMQLLGYRI